MFPWQLKMKHQKLQWEIYYNVMLLRKKIKINIHLKKLDLTRWNVTKINLSQQHLGVNQVLKYKFREEQIE